MTLLNIPLNDGSFYTYQVEQEKDCSFENVQTISIPQLIAAEQKKSIYGKIEYLQQKINLDIEESEITNERITFALSGAENISFEFFYKPATKTEACQLVRVLHYNEQQFNMKAIKIDYNTALKSPVVEKVMIETEENATKDLYIYPWALRGQMSLYELNVGPALNIHTNIRVNDQNKFNKNNPVVEPIPGFFFRYGPVFINKNGLGSLLYNSGEFSVLGMGLLEGEPYEGKNLRERNTHIFAGSIIKYSALELTYYRDFFKNSGYNLKLNIAPEFYYRISWKFSPQFFIQYWDNRYVDEYFGISKQEALDSGLRYYLGTHTINYGTMFEVMHFSGKWTYVMDVGLKVYGKEVYDSPTVSRSREIRFITSVLYKFF